MKRMILNGLALTVIALGGARLHAQDYQACCGVVIGSARCCGDTCQSGWFSCSAQMNKPK